jgi:hypothetical protein
MEASHEFVSVHWEEEIIGPTAEQEGEVPA